MTREQEVVIEPLTSLLTHLDNKVHKITFVTRDDDGVTRDQDVVFETSNNTTHHGIFGFQIFNVYIYYLTVLFVE